jgi:ATP-binding cassette subfamily B protein
MLKSRIFWQQLAAKRGQIGLGLGLIVIANAFSLASPWVLRLAIDDLAKGAAQALPFYAATILALAVAEATVRYATRLALIGGSRRVEYDLRNQLFAHLLRLEAGYYQRMRTGDLVARATNDLNAVRQLFGPGIQNLFNTALMFTVAVGLMFSISPRLAAYTALLLPMISVVFVAFRSRIERRFLAVQEQFGSMSNQAQENFAGIRVVKAYAQEHAEIEDFRRVSDEYTARYLRQVRLSGLLWPMMTLLSGLGVVILIYLGGRDVIEGRLSLGQFVQFYAYLGMLGWPMIALGWVVQLIQQGTASLKRVEEVLERSPGIGNRPRPIIPPTIRGEVAYESVSLSFDRHTALEEVDLRIPAGTTLGIVGPVGSGKSLMASLLLRLHDPSAGRVLIDGVDARDWDLGELRQRIGYVPQETLLFSTTLRANIALGVDEYAPAQLAEVVRIAQLEQDLGQLPKGLDTLIGERGVTLSGGQKQRTALARALMKEPAILILDDALSSVDAATEVAILAALREFMRRRTSIIISHRISAVREADRIVVLGHGRIVEEGTHQELLSRAGPYQRMYRRQLLVQELELDDDAPTRSGAATEPNGRHPARSGGMDAAWG